MNSKIFKPLVLVVSLIIICITTIGSYAYFTASISGNNSAKNNVVVTGHMEVTYQDGSVVGLANNMMPGDSITKSFSVTNTGNIETVYNIYLNNVYNSFNPASDLVYEIISEDGRNVSESVCPTSNSALASNIVIGVGETHHYSLKITFKDTNTNQDSNKGKAFSGKIELLESNGDYEVLATYYNEDGSYDSAQELYNSTNKNYMMYSKAVYEYTNTKERYGKYIYKYSRSTENKCREYMLEEDDPLGINECVQLDNGWALKVFSDEYPSLEVCQNSIDIYQEFCTLLDTYDEPRRMLKSKTDIESKLCAYNNNELVCIDKNKYLNVDYSLDTDELYAFYINMLANELEAKGYECRRSVYGATCLGNQGSFIVYEPGVSLKSATYAPSAETRYLYLETPYDTYDECANASSSPCIEYNDKYYKYSYGNSFEGINADCSNFTSSDYHYVCFPNYYLNSSESYCEYGTYNKCGMLEDPK